MAKALILVALCLPLMGCSLNRVAFGTGPFCELGPIRPTQNDKISRPTGERIVLENETGEAVCGWKP